MAIIRNISMQIFRRKGLFLGLHSFISNELRRGEGVIFEVTVYQNHVERALKVLKRQLTKDGLLKELKR